MNIQLLRALGGLGGGGGFCAEYKTVYAAMTVKPSTIDAYRQNKLVKSLSESGLWSKIDFLAFFSASKSESEFDWANPSRKFTIPAIYYFEKNLGYLGGNNQVIKLNYNPSVNALKHSSLNNTIISCVGSNSTSSVEDFGGFDGTHRMRINSRFTSDNILYSNYANASILESNINAIGYYVQARNGGSTVEYYKNRTRKTSTQTTNGLLNNNISVCGTNDNNTERQNNRFVRFILISSYLTETEVNNVIDIFEDYYTFYKNNIINYTETVASEVAGTRINMPLTTYEGSGSTIHPSVKDYGTNWNGYRYWLANTPLLNDYLFENPCIWCSSDGINWIVPPGVTNPIVPAPTTGYNADTELLFDNGVAYIFFKDSVKGIMVTSSIDSVNWSTPKLVLAPDTDETECVSPSCVKIGDKYYLYYYKYKTNVTNLSQIRRVECSTIDGIYSNRININYTIPSNMIPWHLSILHYNGNYYLAAMCSSNNSFCNYINIYKSEDAVTFIKSPYPTIGKTELDSEKNGLYRPSLTLIDGIPFIYYSASSTANSKTFNRVQVNLY